MMEAVRTSETSVDNYFTRQYIPEDNYGQLTYLNCMQEEIKSRLNSGNACYRSVQNILSSSCCLGT
jgi:hypothetical protein